MPKLSIDLAEFDQLRNELKDKDKTIEELKANAKRVICETRSWHTRPNSAARSYHMTVADNYRSTIPLRELHRYIDESMTTTEEFINLSDVEAKIDKRIRKELDDELTQARSSQRYSEKRLADLSEDHIEKIKDLNKEHDKALKEAGELHAKELEELQTKYDNLDDLYTEKVKEKAKVTLEGKITKLEKLLKLEKEKSWLDKLFNR